MEAINTMTVAGIFAVLLAFPADRALAHCDSTSGPVNPEAREHKDDSVAAGREFVAAYVSYVHFVAGVHDAIVAAGGHQH